MWFEINRIKFTNIQDRDLILTSENKIRGSIGSVIGDRYVKSDENEKILYMEATNIYSHSMSQPLPYDEIEIDKIVKLEEVLITP